MSVFSAVTFVADTGDDTLLREIRAKLAASVKHERRARHYRRGQLPSWAIAETVGNSTADADADADHRPVYQAEVVNDSAAARERVSEEVVEDVRPVVTRASIASSSAINDSANDSETDSDDSEEDSPARPMMKPVFRAAADRLTLVERDVQFANDELEIASEALRVEQRQQQSKVRVSEEIQRQSMAGMVNDENYGDDTDTDEDDEHELGLWKLRELKRIDRERQRQVEFNQLMADDLSDDGNGAVRGSASIIAELTRSSEPIDARNDSRSQSSSMRFMQKYYHQGAFFTDRQSSDAVFDRDFQQPTGEDRTVDKSLLPKVMQVKNFGKKGQSRHTSLREQDTSGNSLLRDRELRIGATATAGRGFHGAASKH